MHVYHLLIELRVLTKWVWWRARAADFPAASVGERPDLQTAGRVHWPCWRPAGYCPCPHSKLSLMKLSGMVEISVSFTTISSSSPPSSLLLFVRYATVISLQIAHWKLSRMVPQRLEKRPTNHRSRLFTVSIVRYLPCTSRFQNPFCFFSFVTDTIVVIPLYLLHCSGWIVVRFCPCDFSDPRQSTHVNDAAAYGYEVVVGYLPPSSATMYPIVCIFGESTPHIQDIQFHHYMLCDRDVN